MKKAIVILTILGLHQAQGAEQGGDEKRTGVQEVQVQGAQAGAEPQIKVKISVPGEEESPVEVDLAKYQLLHDMFEDIDYIDYKEGDIVPIIISDIINNFVPDLGFEPVYIKITNQDLRDFNKVIEDFDANPSSFSCKKYAVQTPEGGELSAEEVEDKARLNLEFEKILILADYFGNDDFINAVVGLLAPAYLDSLFSGDMSHTLLLHECLSKAGIEIVNKHILVFTTQLKLDSWITKNLIEVDKATLEQTYAMIKAAYYKWAQEHPNRLVLFNGTVAEIFDSLGIPVTQAYLDNSRLQKVITIEGLPQNRQGYSIRNLINLGQIVIGSLNLRNKQLVSCLGLESVANINQVQELNLSYNQLTKLPAEIGNLMRLQKLDLSYNQLTKLPESIGNLTYLERLDLSHNQLTKLPASIVNLMRLQKLDLLYNQLIELPAEIGNLTSLLDLDLSYNQLTKLPSSIGNLRYLRWLDLSHNQLTKLPTSIGNLRHLGRIYLFDNQLSFLQKWLTVCRFLPYLNIVDF